MKKSTSSKSSSRNVQSNNNNNGAKTDLHDSLLLESELAAELLKMEMKDEEKVKKKKKSGSSKSKSQRIEEEAEEHKIKMNLDIESNSNEETTITSPKKKIRSPTQKSEQQVQDNSGIQEVNPNKQQIKRIKGVFDAILANDLTQLESLLKTKEINLNIAIQYQPAHDNSLNLHLDESYTYNAVDLLFELYSIVESTNNTNLMQQIQKTLDLLIEYNSIPKLTSRILPKTTDLESEYSRLLYLENQTKFQKFLITMINTKRNQRAESTQKMDKQLIEMMQLARQTLEITHSKKELAEEELKKQQFHTEELQQNKYKLQQINADIKNLRSKELNVRKQAVELKKDFILKESERISEELSTSFIQLNLNVEQYFDSKKTVEKQAMKLKEMNKLYETNLNELEEIEKYLKSIELQQKQSDQLVLNLENEMKQIKKKKTIAEMQIFSIKETNAQMKRVQFSIVGRNLDIVYGRAPFGISNVFLRFFRLITVVENEEKNNSSNNNANSNTKTMIWERNAFFQSGVRSKQEAQNPQWNNIILTLYDMCLGELDRPFKIEAWDCMKVNSVNRFRRATSISNNVEEDSNSNNREKYFDPSGPYEFIGDCSTTVKQVELNGGKIEFGILGPKTTGLTTYSNRGFLAFTEFKIESNALVGSDGIVI